MALNYITEEAAWFSKLPPFIYNTMQFMKRNIKLNLIFCNCCFLFVFMSLITNSYATEILTLENCISLAKENNPKLLQVKMAIEQSRAGVTDAYSSYYPSLGLSSGYSYSDEGDGSFSTSLSARYTIFKGGYIRAGTKIAKAREKNTLENYRLNKNQIVLSVTEAFYKILQKQEQITLTNDVLKRRKEDLSLARLKYNVGRENEPVVKEAEANLLQAEYDLISADEEIVLAKLELNQLLGRSEEDISIQYVDKVVEFPTLDSLVKAAKNERPEIIAEQANREVIEAQVTQTKSNYFPAISVSSSYGLRGDEFLDQNTNWSAGVNLSMPIFDGFSTKAKVKQAAISLKEENLKLKDLQDNIEQEIKQAYSDWKLATKNLEVSNKTLEAVREAYQLTKLQYEQGRTSYFFLQQKESDLTRSETNYLNAQLNLRVSVARLEKAWGRRTE
jgi:outer membrane protein